MVNVFVVFYLVDAHQQGAEQNEIREQRRDVVAPLVRGPAKV